MKILVVFLSFLPLLSCSSQAKKLTVTEQDLISQIGLDVATAAKIKSLGIGDFELSEGNIDRAFLFEDLDVLKEYAASLPKALKINADSENAERILGAFRDELKSNDIILYISEENYGYEDDVIKLLLSTNKYEPLYFEATNAVNYEIYTAEIVEKIKKWDLLYELEIYGVGVDFVHGKFNKLPEDLNLLAQEMYAFCPDIVDQGTGSVEELEKELKNTATLFLWWD